jgi:glycosyltransferase involved in cell wall biosynthesis
MSTRRRLRILFVVQVFYPSQAGGPANSVYWIAKHLDKSQFEPVIVSGDLGLGEEIERDEWMNNEAGEVIYVSTGGQKNSIRQTLVALRRLASVDIVQLSSLFYPPSLFIGMAARMMGKPVLWSTRGELGEPEFSRVSPRQKRGAVKLLRSMGGRVLFHSTGEPETREIREKLGAVEVIEIPNFIELSPQEPEGTLDYILFIGRIHQKKGLENLFEALSKSGRFLTSGMNLKIAGTGERAYEQSLVELAERLGLASRIEFLGAVTGREKQQLYAGARFTVMPSFNENFGMVVLESLAQNTPVIASTGSPWAVLEEEKIGIWTENSPAPLAAAIDRMLTMPDEEYRAMRLRARRFVEARFSIRDNIHHWPAAYERLAEGP